MNYFILTKNTGSNIRSIKIKCRGNIIFWFLKLRLQPQFLIFSGHLQQLSQSLFLIVWRHLLRRVVNPQAQLRFLIFGGRFRWRIYRLRFQPEFWTFLRQLLFPILRQQVQLRVWTSWVNFLWLFFQQRFQPQLWIVWVRFRWQFRLRFWIVSMRIRWRFWRLRFQLIVLIFWENFKLRDWRGN